MNREFGCKLIYMLRELRAALEAQALEKLEARLIELQRIAEGNRSYGDTNGHRPPQLAN